MNERVRCLLLAATLSIGAMGSWVEVSDARINMADACGTEPASLAVRRCAVAQSVAAVGVPRVEIPPEPPQAWMNAASLRMDISATDESGVMAVAVYVDGKRDALWQTSCSLCPTSTPSYTWRADLSRLTDGVHAAEV